MPSRGRAVALPTLALVGVVVAVTASAAGAGQPMAPGLAGGQVDPDSVVLEATLQADGDAGWEVRYRIRLDDDNATEAFESLEEDVRADPSGFAGRFADRMNRTVAAAENATNREMAVRNVSVRTTRQDLGQRYGVLVYAFEWGGFAAANETTIRAGDAIAGLFLDAETTLSIRWPAGYGRVAVEPRPSETGDRSVTWRGPQDFATDQPRVVVRTGAPSSGPGASGDGPPLAMIAGVLVAVAILAGAGMVWMSRRGGAAAPSQVGPDDDELLSNEERVLRLLAENGGRMKQQQVVQELGWTDAKTSQVVGDLREAGDIEAFRLGRENVLSLPDDEA